MVVVRHDGYSWRPVEASHRLGPLTIGPEHADGTEEDGENLLDPISCSNTVASRGHDVTAVGMTIRRTRFPDGGYMFTMNAEGPADEHHMNQDSTTERSNPVREPVLVNLSMSSALATLTGHAATGAAPHDTTGPRSGLPLYSSIAGKVERGIGEAESTAQGGHEHAAGYARGEVCLAIVVRLGRSR